MRKISNDYNFEFNGRTFLIDTGSECNFIKLGVIRHKNNIIKSSKPIKIQGIGPTKYYCDKEIEIKMPLGSKVKCYIVSDDFPIEQNGILGKEFLDEVKPNWDFKQKEIAWSRDGGEFRGEVRENVNIKVISETENREIKKEFDEIYDFYESIVDENKVKDEGSAVLTEDSLLELDYEMTYGEEIKSEGKNVKIVKDRENILKEKIKLKHILGDNRKTIEKIIEEYKDVFFLDGDEIPKIQDFRAKIKVKDGDPINAKCYKQPLHLREECKQIIKQMLKNDIIRPSQSEYNAPCILVPKKRNEETNKMEYRLVIDFRKLNQKIVRDTYPLPNIDDLITRITNRKFLTKLDLVMGFHQLELCEDSKHLTAFSINDRKYEYNRLPMGVSVAPSQFQRIIHEVLKETDDNKVFVFMDDILITGKNVEEHNNNLRQVLKLFRKNNIKIKTEKSEFFKNELEFLGHKITPEGIFPDKAKIETIKKWEAPRTTKQVKSFLGFINFYRKFIPRCAEIARPLYYLTKKDTKFEWNDECQRAFEQLKEKVISPPILAIPDTDPNNPFILHTDASEKGQGAVLSQVINGIERPIAFWSRKVDTLKRPKPIHQLEFEALKNAIYEFRYYLSGNNKFIVYTDNQILSKIHTQKDTETSLMRNWADQLSQYNFEIKHKDGAKLPHADALSRMFVITRNDEVEEALKECHSSLVGGHRDAKTTLEKLKEKGFLWESMNKDTKEYVEKCEICQRTKITQHVKLPMKITDTPSYPWIKIAIDIVGPLIPTTQGNKYILTVRDLFSMFTFAIPMENITAENVARKLVDEIFTKFSMPEIILSDRGSNFCSKLFKNICKLFGIQHIKTTAFRPQSNGSLERFHRTMKTYLAQFAEVREWDQLINMACYAYNTTKNSTTKHSPFYLMFGRAPRIPSNIEQPTQEKLYDYDDYVKWVRHNFREIMQLARKNIKDAKIKQKQNYDKDKKLVKFKIGDKVLLLQDKIDKNLRNPIGDKYLDGYEVIEVLSEHNYKIKRVKRNREEIKVVHGEKLKLKN